MVGYSNVGGLSAGYRGDLLSGRYTKRDVAEYEDTIMDREQVCWETGIYDNDCDCTICSHHGECSGYDEGDD